MMTLTFHDKKESFSIQTNKKEGEWLVEMLQKISVSNAKFIITKKLKLISNHIWRTSNCFGTPNQLKLLENLDY